MRKEFKPEHRYIFCNIDEPYAEEVYEVIKKGQMAKGPEHWAEGDIGFMDWLYETFGQYETEPIDADKEVE